MDGRLAAVPLGHSIEGNGRPQAVRFSPLLPCPLAPVERARRGIVVPHAVEQAIEIAGQLQVRHHGVLELDTGHALVDTFKESQERVVVFLFVVVTCDLVEAELNVGDFRGDGVDAGE